jgi:hypothetical protein
MVVGDHFSNLHYIHILVIEINLYIYKEINQSLLHCGNINHQAVECEIKETKLL